MSYIYKIINTINGKLYIGYTSRSVQERFDEHCIQAKYIYNSKPEQLTYFQKAIMKHGKESFKVQTIYEIPANQQESWSEIEQYYIAKYSSNIEGKGYNLTNGGEIPPRIYGEDNVSARLKDIEFQEIILLLKECELTFSEIAKRYNVHQTTVERINNGKIRFQERLNYPIRKYNIDEVKAIEIMRVLINTNLKYSSIGEIIGVDKTIPVHINKGNRHKKIFSNIRFPVRENIEYNKQFYTLSDDDMVKYSRIQLDSPSRYENRALNICIELFTTSCTHIEIASKHDVDVSLVTKINTGMKYKGFLNMFTFPLRQNAEINKQMLDKLNAVETIPLIGK